MVLMYMKLSYLTDKYIYYIYTYIKNALRGLAVTIVWNLERIPYITINHSHESQCVKVHLNSFNIYLDIIYL